MRTKTLLLLLTVPMALACTRDTDRLATKESARGLMSHMECDALGLEYINADTFAMARADCLRRKAVLDTIPYVVEGLMAASWSISESHDEQPFVMAGGDYGPIVNVFASPFLGQFEEEWQVSEQGAEGFLAAIIHVDQNSINGGAVTGLSDEYTRLGLGIGFNCLYLALDAPGGTWTASMRAFDKGQGRCEDATMGHPLGVRRFTRTGYGASAYPPVARFTWSTDGKPLIGLRCVIGWCDIGPALSGGAPGFAVPAYTGGSPERTVPGWFDQQPLAIRSAAGKLRPGAIVGTIYPMPNIARRSAAFYAGPGYQPVATLNLSADPAGTKYAAWNLRRGDNVLGLRNQGGTWSGEITGNGAFPWVRTTRFPHHDITLPGTARFRFNSYDDGIWIPCGVACCYTEGGT